MLKQPLVSLSVQIIDKSPGRYKVVEKIMNINNKHKIDFFIRQA